MEGSFFNDNSTAIDWISEFKTRIMILRHGEWRELSTATFKDIKIFIRPGQSKRFTFRITGVEPQRFEKWKGSYWMEVHRLDRSRDERRRQHREWD